jgi:hypothetical protein
MRLLDPEPHRDGVGGPEANGANSRVSQYGFSVITCTASEP